MVESIIFGDQLDSQSINIYDLGFVIGTYKKIAFLIISIYYYVYKFSSDSRVVRIIKYIEAFSLTLV